MWEISESDSKFLYGVHWCHQKLLDLRLGNIVHLYTWHYSLKKLALGTSHCQACGMHFYKHAPIFFPSMTNETSIRNEQFTVII